MAKRGETLKHYVQGRLSERPQTLEARPDASLSGSRRRQASLCCAVLCLMPSALCVGECLRLMRWAALSSVRACPSNVEQCTSRIMDAPEVTGHNTVRQGPDRRIRLAHGACRDSLKESRPSQPPSRAIGVSPCSTPKASSSSRCRSGFNPVHSPGPQQVRRHPLQFILTKVNRKATS